MVSTHEGVLAHGSEADRPNVWTEGLEVLSRALLLCSPCIDDKHMISIYQPILITKEKERRELGNFLVSCNP